MKKLQKVLWLTLILAFTVASVAFARSQPPPPRGKGGPQQQQQQQQPEQGILVGRIAHVEGELLRYVPEEQDWVLAIKDTPFGLEDALYSDEDVKAEFIMPNSTWVRIGGSTQIQMIRLADDITETDVASGISRFYNKGSSSVFKITTPFGYVMAPAQTIFDLYVGDESLEVVAIKGSVDFVHIVGDTRYEVVAGEASILADGQQVASGEGTVDEDWDTWNDERDSVWAKRVEVKGDSVKYLPEPLHDESYVLEEQGQWEEVEYEGARRRFWRPTHVEADWVPYSRGHWVEYYEDQNWVPEPEEDFGYVTHHYGSWVNVNSGWYWAPPVVSVGIGVPVVGVGWGWWPGRVGWIHSDVNVGWFPLGWHEPWYTHHYWGPGALVVGGVGFAGVGIGIGGYAWAGHAVIVGHNNFFAHNYHNVRITNINRTTIINNYRSAHVVNNNVVRGYNTNRARFNAAAKAPNRKPHGDLANRINKNKSLAKQDRGVRGKNLERNVGKLKAGKLASADRVKSPKLSSKMAGADRKEKGLKTRAGKPKTPRDVATGKAGGIKSPRGEGRGKGRSVGGEGAAGGRGKGARGGEGAVGGEGARGGRGKGGRGGDAVGGGAGGRRGGEGAVGGEGARGGRGKGGRGGDAVGGRAGGRRGGEGAVGGEGARGGRGGGRRGGDAVGGGAGGRRGGEGAVGGEGARGGRGGGRRGGDAVGGGAGGRRGGEGAVGGEGARGGRGGGRRGGDAVGGGGGGRRGSDALGAGGSSRRGGGAGAVGGEGARGGRGGGRRGGEAVGGGGGGRRGGGAGAVGGGAGGRRGGGAGAGGGGAGGGARIKGGGAGAGGGGGGGGKRGGGGGQAPQGKGKKNQPQ